MALRKTDKADLRRRYPILAEVGLIVSLVLLIVAFKVKYNPDSSFLIPEQEQVVVQMEEIEQTQQIEKPPPPPRPPVPIEVPNDEVLEDEALDIDAEIDFDEPVELPPPPPPAEEAAEPEIFVVVENMPELIGGIEGLQKRVKYPEIAKKAGVEGTVFLQFIVDENGNVVDPVVIKGIGAGCDEAALEAIRTAKFKAGRQRGKPVKVKFSLPVRFRLK
ncbi:MAG TPA: energy transducer TonB [Rhodothermales bacterium]|nr:energy transducer TonB [Rhodothermales bacterium]